MPKADNDKNLILLVDDEKNLIAMLAKILTRHGYDVVLAHNGEEGVEELKKHFAAPDAPLDDDRPNPFDLVVTDLQMPKMDGLALLQHINENHPELPVVVLTGHGSIQSAVDAMKLGATDYLIKPANPEELLIVIKRSLEVRNLRRENQELRTQLGGRFQPEYEIVGSSEPIAAVLQQIESVARNRSNVLIIGESGTGKELIARAIHDSGPFARYPFIAVNCGALSETLLESQLFGHKRGAFTGAVNDHVGFFQAAEGGTLFLDEISEMSPHLQVKLLRAIQEREIIPVGDVAPVRVNLRLVCATNRDLEFEVRRRNFRQDLFYRLSVVDIYLAPLRDRNVDIPDLVGHFILRFAKEYDVSPKSVQPEAMETLLKYPWPGNIRELENVIERCFALSRNDTIGVDDLPTQLFREPEDAMRAMKPMEEGGSGKDGKVEPSSRSAPRPGVRPDSSSSERRLPTFDKPFVPKEPEKPLTLDEMEKKQIAEALRRARGKKVDAAKFLGIDRKRLYRKMKKYELE